LSHARERKERNCLNCETTVQGRYCHHCGQENTEPRETVWALVTHFFYDITHFDGKFFSTVKLLLFKPGFLSKEYVAGRRAGYLNPVRMYVFTSAFFFIIFFSLFNPQGWIGGKGNKEKRLKELAEARASIAGAMAVITTDSVMKSAMVRAAVKIDKEALLLDKEIAEKKKKDSLAGLDGLGDATLALDSAGGLDVPELRKIRKKADSSKAGYKDVFINSKDRRPGNDIYLPEFEFKSRTAYDAVQEALPEGRKDNWLQRTMKYRLIELNTKWKENRRDAISLFTEKFIHKFPQALFVSLPVFALILLLLYARRNFYYVDHVIFSIHLYCATFLLMLIYFGLDKLKTSTNFGIFTFLEFLVFLASFIYLYKAMRGFYRQGRLKTLTKFVILNFLSMLLVTMIFVFFLIIAIWQF
jgi:hypothetical protein